MNWKASFEIKHFFEPSYFDTIAELEAAYRPILDWLNENCIGDYYTSEMDNAAFSDLNEDPWIGYYIGFEKEQDAMAFKLRWL